MLDYVMFRKRVCIDFILKEDIQLVSAILFNLQSLEVCNALYTCNLLNLVVNGFSNKYLAQSKIMVLTRNQD